MTLARYFPILDWSRHYGSVTLTRDLTAAVIVTIMLIPQSFAYAMLAGLPPQVGLYANTEQATIAGVGPSMEGTGEALLLAAFRFGKYCATVAAGINEGMKLAITIAGRENGYS